VFDKTRGVIMKNLFRSILFISLFLAVTFSPCYAWQGKVVGVADGDTITVMHNGKGEKIRLYGIDTPEKRQDFGQKAKKFTSDMVFGKVVEVTPVTTDRYGRTVGLVYVEGKCMNRELVKSGFAWVYRKYCDKPICKEWLKLEGEVKKYGWGLWSKLNPTPPWEFRRSKRKGASTKGSEAVKPDGVYHGNVNSKVFHKSSCMHYNCKNCTAGFNTRKEAIKAGYRPCGRCRP
jgi:endonuclease YncB( thermonuclease family)